MNMNPFKNLIDNIFSLPESILRFAKEKLTAAGSVVAQGLDISAWLSPISILGPSWTKVINSLLAGATLVLTLWVAKKIYHLYLQFKEGVRWW